MAGRGAVAPEVGVGYDRRVARTPEFRIGDAERNATMERLTSAFGEGRLDLDEFEDRVASVEQAKTRTDLVPLTADLPASTSAPQPVVEPPSRDVDVAQTNSADWFRGAMAPFFMAPIICTAIYAMTDFGGYFWPMWVWFGCMIPVLSALFYRGSISGDKT